METDWQRRGREGQINRQIERFWVLEIHRVFLKILRPYSFERKYDTTILCIKHLSVNGVGGIFNSFSGRISPMSFFFTHLLFLSSSHTHIHIH